VLGGGWICRREACHPERSEAQSKEPGMVAWGNVTGLKAWPRPESFRGCVTASTSLGLTVIT